MIDHPSSSGMEPVIGAPTFSPGVVAVLHGKDDDEEHDEQREERRDRRDEEIQVIHLGSEVGRLFGKSGMPDSIDVSASHARRGARRLTAPHQQDESGDGQHRHDARRAAPGSSPPRRSGRSRGRSGSSRAAARRSPSRSSPCARLHERQAQLLRRVLDAVEVAGQPPSGVATSMPLTCANWPVRSSHR